MQTLKSLAGGHRSLKKLSVIMTSHVLLKWKSLVLKTFIVLTVCASYYYLVLEQNEEKIFDTSPQTPDAIELILLSLSNYSTKVSSEFLPKKLSSDASRLSDVMNFGYLINHPSCKELNIKPTVVMMVHSEPSNFDKRDVIRETWGSKDNNSILIFLLARVSSTELQAKIEYENQMHGDLVQGNFVDAYRNLTYKHIMALKWFVYNCPSAPFLLKSDDDMFINTPLMYKYLQPPTKLPSEKLMFCLNRDQEPVLRNPCKWQVTKEEYEDDVYPSYCVGWAIIYSADVVRDLYFKAQIMPYFWIDDVFITGDVRLRINVNITTSDKFFLGGSEKDQVLSGEIEAQNRPIFLFGAQIDEDVIRKLWSIIQVPRNSSLNEI